MCLLSTAIVSLDAQEHTVARQWNEEVLNAIRNDFARPTVHARNLFHTSGAMYDLWAFFDATARPYLLGQTLNGFTCPVEDFPMPSTEEERIAAVNEAISFAVYRIMLHRFRNSPGFFEIRASIQNIMTELGYDIFDDRTDYVAVPEAFILGNYLAQCYIDYGLEDGANELFDYENNFYQPVNPALSMVTAKGNPDLVNPNRWQPLALEVFIDQSGNVRPFNAPPFLGAEWGRVHPYALTEEDKSVYYNEDSTAYTLYHDPGPPPLVMTEDTEGYLPEEYAWGFALVAVWAGHLDQADGVMIDISPRTIGNIPSLPTNYEEYRTFYNLIDGGDPSIGRDVNPITNTPYETQMVPRGDYTRVLAEFWADGPDSETPPGHWFTILNTVMDHPMHERKWQGTIDIVDPTEYDVKAYMVLAGTMHDAAVTAWGIKGRYDYIRPVSAIRWMAGLGQSTDPEMASYHPDGISLIPGHIELVQEGDTLLADAPENLNKIKLYSWQGPSFIDDPSTDQAGVGWILADDWWPYQRPSFVTPPFAGYISGHSTFSRAAAEVLTMMTGDEYFPGGLGEFEVKKDEFLVFEQGPSVDMTLQWATYRDASEQTSLSRIWGGIHPPADDIPGRWIGLRLGKDAFNKSQTLFGYMTVPTAEITVQNDLPIGISPNPGRYHLTVDLSELDIAENSDVRIALYDISGRRVATHEYVRHNKEVPIDLDVTEMHRGVYWVEIATGQLRSVQKVIIH